MNRSTQFGLSVCLCALAVMPALRAGEVEMTGNPQGEIAFVDLVDWHALADCVDEDYRGEASRQIKEHFLSDPPEKAEPRSFAERRDRLYDCCYEWKQDRQGPDAVVAISACIGEYARDFALDSLSGSWQAESAEIGSRMAIDLAAPLSPQALYELDQALEWGAHPHRIDSREDQRDPARRPRMMDAKRIMMDLDELKARVMERLVPKPRPRR